MVQLNHDYIVTLNEEEGKALKNILGRLCGNDYDDMKISGVVSESFSDLYNMLPDEEEEE